MIRQHYFAATTYVDHLIGQLLASLSDLHLDNNTIIALFGDHGRLQFMFLSTKAI
jgi:iduronate 2-sulfatase